MQEPGPVRDTPDGLHPQNFDEQNDTRCSDDILGRNYS